MIQFIPFRLKFFARLKILFTGAIWAVVSHDQNGIPVQMQLSVDHPPEQAKPLTSREAYEALLQQQPKETEVAKS